MNIETDIDENKPFLIGETSTIKITFEIGDVFINKNNKVILIVDFVGNKVEFRDVWKNMYFEELPLSKYFRSKYRFAGTVKDDDLPIYEDALILND